MSDPARRASQSTVASLFAARARLHPRADAVVDGARTLSPVKRPTSRPDGETGG